MSSYLSKDDATLDYLVNKVGLDQLTASRMIWVREPGRHDLGPIPPDPRTATPEDHRRWSTAWIRHAVLTHFAPVLLWLTRSAPQATLRDLLNVEETPDG